VCELSRQPIELFVMLTGEQFGTAEVGAMMPEEGAREAFNCEVCESVCHLLSLSERDVQLNCCLQIEV
jgi:hypothetical protein